MVISFGLRCREDRRRLAVISARDVFDDHDGVARRDVCSRMRERRVTAVSIDSACGTTARLALEWFNVGAGPIDDSRRLQRKD